MLVGGRWALALAAAGTYLVSRGSARHPRPGPAELAQMYEYHDAVLHAVREGLLLLGRDGRVQLVNDEARRLLDLPDDAVGRPSTSWGCPWRSPRHWLGGVRSDEIHLTADRVLVVNQAAARWDGRAGHRRHPARPYRPAGAGRRAGTVRGFAESLRAQAHEAANRLHTVISLIELGRADEALEFATAELAAAQQLTDAVVAAVGEPELAALLLGKAAQAREQGVDLARARHHIPGGLADARDLVTIVGNLVDNAIDAARAAPAPAGHARRAGRRRARS